MRRTIFACVIVALIAGATSATAANLITGSDIKNGSITGADIKNPTIDSEDIKKGAVIKKKLSKAVRDALDDHGPAGPQGPAGPPGPLGGRWAPGSRWAAGSRCARAPLGELREIRDRRDRPATPRTPRSASPPSSCDRTPDDDNDTRRPSATYAVPLGSPGSTTSGQFRFSCSPAQAPCKISIGAAVHLHPHATAGTVPCEDVDPKDGHDGWPRSA